MQQCFLQRIGDCLICMQLYFFFTKKQKSAFTFQFLRRLTDWCHNYCAFHKYANSKVQKPPSQLRFSLPSIIITITSNEPWNTETHKTDRNPPIRNHNPWPFEPVKVKFCFLRGPLRWLTAAKNAIVSWLLNFRIRMFVKSAVKVFVFNQDFFWWIVIPPLFHLMSWCVNFKFFRQLLENDLVVFSHREGYQQNFWKTPFRSDEVDKIRDSVISVTIIEDTY